MLNFRYPDKPVEVSPNAVANWNESRHLAQWKYDGWRMLVFIDGLRQVRCLTRQNRPMASVAGRNFHSSFIDQLLVLGVPNDTVFDTELVGPRGGHSPRIYIFDCLAWDGEWLTSMPFEQRWNIVSNLGARIQTADRIFGAHTIESGFLEEYNRLKQQWQDEGEKHLCEGLVIKKRTGKAKMHPKSCQKSTSQFKLKYRDIQSPQYG